MGKRGPKPGTPSWRKFDYSGELLADCRHRYEATAESVASIARSYGVDESTVRRMAGRFGWVKCRRPPLDLPPAARLLREAEALVQILFVPAQAGTQGKDRSASGPGSGSPLARGRTDDSMPAETVPPLISATIANMHDAVLAELATVKRLRARMKDEPQKPADAQRTAQTLSTLTDTLHRLARLAGPAGCAGVGDH